MFVSKVDTVHGGMILAEHCQLDRHPPVVFEPQALAAKPFIPLPKGCQLRQLKFGNGVIARTQLI